MSGKVKDEFFIYSIYDIKEDKIVSDLTSRHKKWYESEGNARRTLEGSLHSRSHLDDYKIIKFKCEKVEEIDV